MRVPLSVGLSVLVLSGCATGEVSVRRLPDESPAADNAAAIARMQAAAAAAGDSATGIGATGARATGASAAGAGATQGGYAATGGAPATPSSPSASSGAGDSDVPPPLTPADAPSMYTYDPLERINRFTYRFNARFDEHIFLPAANGYRRIPAPVRSGVHNFFRNLSEITSTVNYGLQWRLGNGARSLGRFAINSTLGIGGLFDVASKFKLNDEQTGFGATLSTWGVHPGPYLVIPLLGPSACATVPVFSGTTASSMESTSWISTEATRVMAWEWSTPWINAPTSISATTAAARRSSTKPSAFCTYIAI